MPFHASLASNVADGLHTDAREADGPNIEAALATLLSFQPVGQISTAATRGVVNVVMVAVEIELEPRRADIEVDGPDADRPAVESQVDLVRDAAVVAGRSVSAQEIAVPVVDDEGLAASYAGQGVIAVESGYADLADVQRELQVALRLRSAECGAGLSSLLVAETVLEGALCGGGPEGGKEGDEASKVAEVHGGWAKNGECVYLDAKVESYSVRNDRYEEPE